MTQTTSSRFLALAVLLIGYQPYSYANKNESIVINQQGQVIELSVPVSDVTLQIPKANFAKNAPVKGGATASPRYFTFSDNVSGITLSGWFEHSRLFKGVEEPRPASLQGKPLIYKDINFIKIGAWDAVSYNVLFQSNKIANIKAHLVQGNTWIDLHVSGKINGSLTEQHKIIKNLISSIKVLVKN